MGYNLLKKGEVVIWRDDANLEFISYAKHVPIRVFLPEGCRLFYKHRNVEYIEYDHKKIRDLFPQFENGYLNVLLFDLFTTAPVVAVRFWVRFFQEIYRYKRARIHEPWSLVIDELNDLAPGSRRGYVRDQLKLASQIYFNMKKFRKMRLRLVGSTHNYNDLHRPVRTQFNYVILKSMRREMVPEALWAYGAKIEHLPVDRVWIMDESGNFQMDIEWSEYISSIEDSSRRIKLSPLRVSVPFDGEIEEEETKKETKKSEQWRLRALKTLKLAIDHGADIDYRALENLWGVSQSYSWKLFQKIHEI